MFYFKSSFFMRSTGIKDKIQGVALISQSMSSPTFMANLFMDLDLQEN